MLLAYHPSNGSTIALMDKLWFGNGVALSPEEDYVLVADSIQMKIHRCGNSRWWCCKCVVACRPAVGHVVHWCAEPTVHCLVQLLAQHSSHSKGVAVSWKDAFQHPLSCVFASCYTLLMPGDCCCCCCRQVLAAGPQGRQC
jgi:hypothetical protein